MKTLKILLCLVTTFCAAQDPALELESFATGFTRPIDIQNAGDDRLFIVEQDGVIKIIDGGVTNATPFLSIAVNSGGNEQGLLGLAFHPDYDSNGFFYVNYTQANGSTQISRFEVSSDPDIADAGSEFPILNVSQPFANHNGGCLQFGADGYLYIGLGDGGSANDPQNIAQNPTRLLGKMLRIDINDTNGSINYVIPDDNPFVTDSSVRDEIWAIGVRNPWKFSFDAVTNDLWIADVGQNEIEEVNMVSAGVGGQNYGWRCYEGDEDFNTSGCADASTYTFPLASYTHTTDGEFKCSVTGGYVYRGSSFPAMVGFYIFADFCSNELAFVDDTTNIQFAGPFSGGLSSFGEDINNELYVAALNTGIIYQVVDANLSVDDVTTIPFNLFPNPAVNQVTLTMETSSDLVSQNRTERLRIFDLSGRTVQTLDITASKTIFSIADLPAGIYIAQLENSGQTQKLIIR